MDSASKRLNEAVRKAEEKIRSAKAAQDRTDWEGNHPEERR